VTESAPARGEVWLVEFGPSRGGEIQKTRPAMVLSRDSSNIVLNRLQVVPVSSQVARLYASEALVLLNGAPRKAMADQITTVAKERLFRRLGQMSADDVEAVARVVRLQLGL